MSSALPDAGAIIRGLKAHFGVWSDDALSQKIGVAKSTIATWRRRGISKKVMDKLERNDGLSIAVILDAHQNQLRDYVLREALYHIVIQGARLYAENHEEESAFTNLADEFAILDPYLKKTIAKAAAVERFRGLTGVVSFLLALRSGEIDMLDLIQAAKADRKRDLDSDEHDASGSPASAPGWRPTARS